jgi:hypothetical protein
MAHFAKIEDSKVVNVLVIPNEQEHRALEFIAELGLEGEWIQTSFNANLRTRFAGIGDTYNAKKDRFEPPKVMPSWVWDETNYCWKTPVEEPKDGQIYTWDEATTSWIVAE